MTLILKDKHPIDTLVVSISLNESEYIEIKYGDIAVATIDEDTGEITTYCLEENDVEALEKIGIEFKNGSICHC